MTILDLTSGLKKVSTTNGGEYAGPCPFCGGRDRFRVWPNEGTTGKFWCRGCGKSGDAITLLKERDGLGYREACLRLGVLPALSWKPGHRTEPTPTTWTPKEATAPGNTWQEKAGAFLAGCQKTLAGPSGADCREWLTGRGLKPETIERAGLGWNNADAWQSRKSWGLPSELNDKGKLKKVWLPAGLVIPHLQSGRVIRLRVRRPDPGADPRYVIISGSASSPLTLPKSAKSFSLGTGGVLIVVESELDAILLNQEAGDLVGVIALGFAQARPDQETDKALREAGLILVSLDSDQAGAKEAWGFWKRTYPNAKRWPIPTAKDPGEGWQKGLDLRAWVMAGLPGYQFDTLIEPEPATAPAQEQATAKQEGTGDTHKGKTYQSKGADRRAVIKPFPKEWQERFDEGTLERLAILTVDGGLSDAEAERRVLH